MKLFARLLAELMTTRHPDRFTARMSKARREGRIFIDWLRNERGASAIAPFSLRARPGAPVAVPVTSSEPETSRTAAQFDLRAALERSADPGQAVSPVSLNRDRIERLEAAFA